MTDKYELDRLIDKLKAQPTEGNQHGMPVVSRTVLESVLGALVRARAAALAYDKRTYLENLDFAAYQILDGWPRQHPLGGAIVKFIDSESTKEG